MPLFTQEDFEGLTARVGREVARRLSATWDFGLEEEIERLLDEGRYADALLLASEIEARWREGCDGGRESGGLRRDRRWLDRRAGALARAFTRPPPGEGRRDTPPPEPASRTRLDRLGVSKEALV